MNGELNTQEENQTNNEELNKNQNMGTEENKVHTESDDLSIENMPSNDTGEQDTATNTNQEKESEMSESQSHNEDSKLEKALQEAASYQDQLLRLQAEFSNFRKRKQKESDENVRKANVSFMKSLLPVFDNMYRSLAAMRKADNMADVEKSIDIIERYIDKHFEKLGISRMESVGLPFDLELHEAISAVPVEEEEKKGVVIDEVEAGYKLKDNIIRFSKVIVGE